jgi:protein-disulfide isomerase
LYRGGTSPSGNGDTGGTNPPTVGGTAPTKPTVDVDQIGPRDVILGDQNAPVTVVEYGDYQCPFCGIFFTQVEPTLKSQYIDTGKVKFIFRDFAFLGAESVAAGEAAECALDQGAFWAYHDALYAGKVADVAKGGSEDDGFFNPTLFNQLANNVGIDTTTFASCVSSNKYAGTITAESTAGQAAGVNSTPTTFVDGKMVTDATGNSVGANATAILSAVATAVAGK